MKHSYGITFGLHLRQPDYTRGQPLRRWLLGCYWGAYSEEFFLNQRGGSGRRYAWARLTLLGISLQINVEHARSNWHPTSCSQSRASG